MNKWDVIVIGGGAAGLMSAASAAGCHKRTLLLEKNNKLGVKILMSGGTRCNITHECDARGISEAFGLHGKHSQGQFLRSALGALPPAEVVRIVETNGVLTKVESTGKIFPVSDRAIDVRDALVNFARQLGATLQAGQGVESIGYSDGLFDVCTQSEKFSAPSIIITTGGKSYPGCGTTGDGYAWAEKFGHSIVAPVPALTPVRATTEWAKDIKGITIEDVAVKVLDRPRADETAKQLAALRSARGSFLFTHFGFSGPAPLNVSRAIARHEQQNTLTLECDFSPDKNLDLLREAWKSRFDSRGKQSIGNSLAELFPRRLAESFLQIAEVNARKKCAELGKSELNQLLRAVKQLRFPVSGVLGFKKAEVTAGGVALSEVNSRTMESNFQSGLFFAGEVLDVDGPIGGFNFQAAFSTGWLAGQHAAGE